MNASGPVRDCQHKYARHEHGTRTAYVRDRCKCRPCLDANGAAERRNRRLKAYGRYDSGRVDAQPVREHIEFLRASGLGLKRIANLAGVSNATLGKILYGDPSRDMPPRARVEKHVHDQVMAVQPALEHLGAKVPVPGVGTRRRLQALVVIGYSMSYLALRLGMIPTNMGRLVCGRGDVGAGMARNVAALYLELQNHPRVGTDWRSRISVTRSRRFGRAQGWLPPAAWDEERMDDSRHKGYRSAVLTDEVAS